MKRMLLFIAAGLMMTISAQANEISQNKSIDFTINDGRYRNAQPVLFTYDNVDYAIFPNGRIEFELPNRYARSSNRRGVGRRYNVNNTSTRRSYDRNDRRNFVRYNSRGQVAKIGNTRIFYNRQGDVRKVGTLRVNYNHGNLSRVGGLEVRYNRRGQLIAARGHVLVRRSYGYGHDCNDHNFGHFNDEQDNHQDWDDGVYFERKAKNNKVNKRK